MTPVDPRLRALNAAIWSYIKVHGPAGDAMFVKLQRHRRRASSAWIMRHAPPRVDAAAFFDRVDDALEHGLTARCTCARKPSIARYAWDPDFLICSFCNGMVAMHDGLVGVYA